MRSRLFAGAAALAVLSSSIQAAPAPAAPAAPSAPPARQAGSAYLQCDGQPNNMTDGEMAARLLGAVTLLGIFARPPESPDASKRQFGAAGVAACSSLIDGERREGNVNRRIGLILGRAIHQIEAKSYDAALADVRLARAEAEAGGLTRDPYWAASRGRSFDQVEAAALLRAGRATEAQAVSLRLTEQQRYSLFGLLDLKDYDDFLATMSEAEDRHSAHLTRLAWPLGSSRASRLEHAGRFADAARLRDAMVDFDSAHTPELNDSTLLAQAAVAHALAGNLELAAERARAARANNDSRKAAGKAERDQAELIELLDLHGIIDTAAKGDMRTARRLFAARSEWVAPSFGMVAEANRRLRSGASAEELIGGLAKTPDQLWAERVDAKRAALLATDSDNRTLFYLPSAAQPASVYTALSRNVWNVARSRIIITRPANSRSQFESMLLVGTPADVALQAYLLHAALTARARGHQGFVFQPILDARFVAASFRSGNAGEPGFGPDFFFEAEPVIERLRQLIPDLEALRARQRRNS